MHNESGHELLNEPNVIFEENSSNYHIKTFSDIATNAMGEHLTSKHIAQERERMRQKK
jgi:hypothetical protein